MNCIGFQGVFRAFCGIGVAFNNGNQEKSQPVLGSVAQEPEAEGNFLFLEGGGGGGVG